jgi:hypothetical protein
MEDLGLPTSFGQSSKKFDLKRLATTRRVETEKVCVYISSLVLVLPGSYSFPLNQGRGKGADQAEARARQ